MTAYTGKFFLVEAILRSSKEIITIAVSYTVDDAMDLVEKLAVSPDSETFFAFRVTSNGDYLMTKEEKKACLN